MSAGTDLNSTITNGKQVLSSVDKASLRGLNVLVVDNQDLVREALVSLLEKESGIEKLRAVSSIAEGECVTEDPDLIIVDPLSLISDLDPSSLVARLRDRFPLSQILILTDSDTPTDVRSCLAAGARGYLLKTSRKFDLTEALRKLAGGEEYLQPSLGAMLLRNGQEVNGSANEALLNQTEIDVLRLLALGHTNAEVAAILSFGVRTIEGYRSRLMTKLGIRTRAELVRAASSLGLLEMTQPESKGSLGQPA